MIERKLSDYTYEELKDMQNKLKNLKVLTWFENRAKCDMTNGEWQEFKLKTKTISAYFV